MFIMKTELTRVKEVEKAFTDFGHHALGILRHSLYKLMPQVFSMMLFDGTSTRYVTPT